MTHDTVRRILEDARDAKSVDLARLMRMQSRVSFPSLEALIDRTGRELGDLNTALEHGWPT